MGIQRSEALDRLFEAVLKLESVDECYDFFEDLCTVRELRDLSQRLELAGLLNRGLSYQAVAERVRVSSTTISRVKTCLEYGSGGYRMILARMENEE